MQIPNFEEMMIASIIREAAKAFDRNGDIFADMQYNCRNLSLENYYNMMTSCYSEVEVWQTNYIHQIDNSDAVVEFVKGTALIPYLERLKETQEENSYFC